jgi:ferredoxin/flavodoxin---NADP+ reductase
MGTALSGNATLLERIDLDPTLVIFRIRPDDLPIDGGPWFLPGQYVTLGEGDVQRAYSIASDPGERRWLEFYIRYARTPATETPFTHVLWQLPVGSRLHVGTKIVGRFTLERTVGAADTRWKLLVAAGTGIAPFMSMVRRARREGDRGALARMALLHGVSHPHELAYRDELSAAVADGLRYVPTVSRPKEHPEWSGMAGRVESLFEDAGRAKLEAALGTDGPLHPDDAVVYVCGFQGTIAESVRRLLHLGFVPEDRKLRRMLGIPDAMKPSLFFEQYDLEPVFDPKDAALVESLRAEWDRREAR